LKIILCGHSRHGKGECAAILESYYGLRSHSSSWVAKEQVYALSPELQAKYSNAWDAHKNRHEDRPIWYKAIQAINTPCKHTLADIVFELGDVYDGMRDREELRSCVNEYADLLTVWVFNPTVKAEESSSNSIRAADCDIVLMNAGTLPDFQRKIKRVFCNFMGVGV